jgi:hypothetical protein
MEKIRLSMCIRNGKRLKRGGRKEDGTLVNGFELVGGHDWRVEV